MPRTPAEKTTSRATNVRRRCRTTAPDRSVCTSHPPPSDRLEIDHLGVGVHGRAVALGEVQVVAVERVLGTDAAARHARPAAGAPDLVGSLPTEVRVGHTGAGLAEPDTDRRAVVGVGHAELVGEAVHVGVGRGVGRDLVDAEHPLGLVVERRQLGPPVGDVAPLRVGVEGRERLVERVRVDQRTATHARTGQDGEVAQRRDPLDAPQAERRRPQEPPQVPRGARQVPRREPPTGLDHADPVALLGQPQGGHAATEARAHHHDVVVEVSHRTIVPDQALPSETGRPGRGRMTGTVVRMATSHDYRIQAQTYDRTRAASPSVVAPLLRALGPHGRVADVGGGTGNYAAAVRAHGFEPVVVDRSADMLGRRPDEGPAGDPGRRQRPPPPDGHARRGDVGVDAPPRPRLARCPRRGPTGRAPRRTAGAHGVHPGAARRALDPRLLPDHRRLVRRAPPARGRPPRRPARRHRRARRPTPTSSTARWPHCAVAPSCCSIPTSAARPRSSSGPPSSTAAELRTGLARLERDLAAGRRPDEEVADLRDRIGDAMVLSWTRPG